MFAFDHKSLCMQIANQKDSLYLCFYMNRIVCFIRAFSSILLLLFVVLLLPLFCGHLTPYALRSSFKRHSYDLLALIHQHHIDRCGCFTRPPFKCVFVLQFCVVSTQLIVIFTFSSISAITTPPQSILPHSHSLLFIHHLELQVVIIYTILATLLTFIDHSR